MNGADITTDALAVCRLTRLATKDKITEGPRERMTWAVRRHPKLTYLLTCPWCMSIYVAAVTVAARRWVPGWRYVARALAYSQVAGLLANLDIDEPLDIGG